MRSISKEVFFRLFEQNTEFEELEVNNNSTVKMSAYEAFIYSNITGSGYLDSLVMPFTPKGLMKIFQSENNQDLVTGLWDKFHPYYTPRKIAQARSYITCGDKYVIPLEFTSEVEYNEQIRQLFYAQDFPGQFLIQRMEKNKRGSGLESLIEYFTCEHFRTMGYIVDNQFPLSQACGTPDWVAIGTDLPEYGSLRKKGAYLFEFAMPSFFGDRKFLRSSLENTYGKSIVGEVKVTATNSIKQLNKYLSTNFFDSGVFCFTDRFVPNNSHASIVYFDENWKFSFERGTDLIVSENSSNYEKFIQFMLLNVKIYLLSSFDDFKILDILSISSFSDIHSKENFISRMNQIDIETMLKIG